jgi:hypothetical protein
MHRVLFAAAVLAAGMSFAVSQASGMTAPPGPAKPAAKPAVKAAAPAKPVATPAPVARAHDCGCHATRVHATWRRTWKRHAHLAAAAPRRTRDDIGVAPSQAWVYRQELAGHGLASAAMPLRRPWHGGVQTPPPPPPPVYAQGGGGRGESWSWRGAAAAPGCCNRGYGYERREHADGVPPWRRAQGGGYEVYGYAGRDANGFLVWANKPRP